MAIYYFFLIFEEILFLNKLVVLSFFIFAEIYILLEYFVAALPSSVSSLHYASGSSVM